MIFDDTAFFGLSYSALIIAALAYVLCALGDVPLFLKERGADGRFLGRVGIWAGVAAASTLFAGLIWRTSRAGPGFWADPALLCLALAFTTAASQPALERLAGDRYGRPGGGGGPALLSLLLESLALFVVPAVRPNGVSAPLALGEPWFTVHTVVTLWAYGLLAVAVGHGLAALWVAVPQELYEGQLLSVALGVVVLSFGLIFGGWWAWSTAGLYVPASGGLSWGLVVWLVYAAIFWRNSALDAVSRKALFLPALGFVTVAASLWAMAVF